MALVGATAPRARAGTVAGVVSAVGGVVGLGPPLLLATAYGVNGTYGVGLALLAGVALTGAVYLRLRGRHLGTALAFPASIAPGNDGTVVVAVSTPPIGTHLAQTMASLTTLANHQEVVIVAGGADRLGGYELVVALRTHLPRHRIVAVAVGELPHHHELGVMVDLLNEGALPVVLSCQARPDGVAFVVADALGARRVLTLARDRADGVVLRPPWAPLPATADC
jgi:hypothetical protein